MSIPGVSFHQTQDTQSWAEFGRNLVIYTAAFCLPAAALFTCRGVNTAYKAISNTASIFICCRRNPFIMEREKISRAIDRMGQLSPGDFCSADERIKNAILALFAKGDTSGAPELDRKRLGQHQAYLQRPEVRHAELIKTFTEDTVRVVNFLTNSDLAAALNLATALEARYNLYTEEQKEVLTSVYSKFQTAQGILRAAVGTIWARTDAEVWADIDAEHQANLN
ncbi:MAG TPA: hypothetical protein VLG44_06995 [Chlamydiales bacterium]|nr:hypothetical protein [Chlamydiales bacterium]